MSNPGSQDDRSGPPDWLAAVLLIEAAALLIALVTPVTPSKTGSTWTPAELLFVEPSYLEKVLVSFLFVNILIGVFGGLLWIAVLRQRQE